MVLLVILPPLLDDGFKMFITFHTLNTSNTRTDDHTLSNALACQFVKTLKVTTSSFPLNLS